MKTRDNRKCKFCMLKHGKAFEFDDEVYIKTKKQSCGESSWFNAINIYDGTTEFFPDTEDVRVVSIYMEVVA